MSSFKWNPLEHDVEQHDGEEPAELDAWDGGNDDGSGLDPLAFTPARLRFRVKGWTPERKTSAETACVQAACARVGLSVSGAYKLRAHPEAASFPRRSAACPFHERTVVPGSCGGAHDAAVEQSAPPLLRIGRVPARPAARVTAPAGAARHAA